MWEVFKSVPRGRGGHLRDAAVKFSRSMAKGKTPRLNVCISANVLREMRWKAGDRVNLVFNNKAQLLGIQRDQDGQYSLINNADKKRGANVYFRATLPEENLCLFVGEDARTLDDRDIAMEFDTNMIVIEMLPPPKKIGNT